MSPSDESSYDQVPYPSVPFRQSHPDRLAAVATLFGLTPPPPATSRVLEIGCALGDNVIPLALQHPDAQILGIDLSPSQIATARERASSVGASNVRFEPIDVFEFPADLGPFDYILCHGVYSWVPDAVRTAILEVIRAKLTPAGIAYVSFNTNPGWRMKHAVRDILLHGTRGVTDPEEKIDRSEALLAFLSKGIPKGLPLHQVVASAAEQETSREIRRAHIYHEYLEDVNEAFYFHEFVERIAGHELQFLAEADISEMQSAYLPDEAQGALAQLEADPIEREQYLDFVKSRAFRQSLLCHASVPVDRSLTPDRLAGLQLSSDVQVVGGASDATSRAPVLFRDDRGREVGTDNPVSRAALLHLNEIHPGAISLEELERAARERTSDTSVTVQDRASFDATRVEFRSDMMQLVKTGFIEVHAAPPTLVRVVSERPSAGPWTRLQAASGSIVTNQRHRPVDLNAFRRTLLTLLDGTRTHEEIVADLSRAVRSNDLVISREGAEVSDPEALLETLRASLPEELEAAARTAFLIG